MVGRGGGRGMLHVDTSVTTTVVLPIKKEHPLSWGEPFLLTVGVCHFAV
jgi:hypothetical protein